jgi:hypothetical protein
MTSGSKQKQKFLFINKDSTSASLSNNRDGQELSYGRINSHVQTAVPHQRSVGISKAAQNDDAASTARRTGWVTRSSRARRQRIRPRVDAYGRVEDHIDQPQAAIDSICNAIITLDSDRRNVLQYYINVCMPSPTETILPGCNLLGFTPLSQQDRAISLDVVRGAFQTDHDFSMYALLAGTARRMEMMGQANFSRTELPSVYILKAIMALRTIMQRQNFADKERLIVDLSYMMNSEAFGFLPSRSKVFWQIIKDLITTCGGFAKIQPFTALLAIANDILAAFSAMTAPALNPYKIPALVGLKIDANELGSVLLSRMVQDELDQLDARTRLMLDISNYVGEVLGAIAELPKSAFTGLLPYTHGVPPRMFGISYHAFFNAETAMAPRSIAMTASVYKADVLGARARYTTIFTWMWYHALYSASAEIEPGHHARAPQDILTEIPNVARYVQEMYQNMRDEGWLIPHHVYVWVVAFGVLVTTGNDHAEYAKLLRMFAAKLKITSQGKLDNVLSAHLPLDCTASHPSQRLWSVMQAGTLS